MKIDVFEIVIFKIFFISKSSLVILNIETKSYQILSKSGEDDDSNRSFKDDAL